MDSQSQLTLREFPRTFLFGGGFFLLAGVILYVFSPGNQQMAIFAGGIGLAMILLTILSLVTITIDKNRGLMRIKSLWKRSAIEIPLKELNDIEVQTNSSGDSDTYRLVAVKNNGARIPLRGAYTSGLSSYQKTAARLCDFIGLKHKKGDGEG